MKSMSSSLLVLCYFKFRTINIKLISSQIESELKQKIIYLGSMEKWEISSIAAKTRADQDQINEILSDFMDTLKLMKTQEQADKLQQETNRVRKHEEVVKK